MVMPPTLVERHLPPRPCRRTFRRRAPRRRVTYVRMMVSAVAVLWLAFTTPAAGAVAAVPDVATGAVHSQITGTPTAGSLRDLRSLPAEASPGEAESSPLSIVMPIVLLVVWLGSGVVMFRRARHKRTNRS